MRDHQPADPASLACKQARRGSGGTFRRGAGFVLLLAAAAPASAAPWLEAGDRALRSDVELLAAYGLIDNLVTNWPMPRGQFRRLEDKDLIASQPRFVQLAALRVFDALYGPQSSGATISVRGTGAPAVVRDFGTTARDEADARVGYNYSSGNFDARLSAGVITDTDGENDHFAPDNTTLSLLAGNLRIYAGWAEKWQGPGAMSALVLSNNARPYPKIGLLRDNPAAFETPWLSWLGPIQSDFSVGLLDDNRYDDNTVLVNWRLSASPLRGLELAGMRTVAFCGGKGPEDGNGHTCNPFNAAAGIFNNDATPNKTNDQATIEFKYTGTAGQTTWSPYIQAMSESSFAYFTRLGGVSLSGPWGGSGAHWQLVGEYTTSIATYAIGGTTPRHGEAYRNAGYVDGSRYRNRTLGFSLDSDSRLASFSAMLVDSKGLSYRAVYHHVNISTPELAAKQADPEDVTYRNTVSPVPLSFDEVNLGLTIPLHGLTLDFILRARSEKLPGDLGGRADGEMGITYRF